ncbi:UV radiation resistance protein and autophagy-related subunit 14-domain-containing protein [Myxozyma melibiosi]|uniref:Autophagy-related protein 14 n=1 Tax=Myxozyma melibiosi TaxID=54550 RepID=A0ABR1F0Z4_9ASCO
MNHTHPVAAATLCALCSRPDTSLTCPRCATAQTLSARLRVLTALSSRAAVVADLDESGALPRSNDARGFDPSLAARIDLSLDRLRDNITAVREATAREAAKAADLSASNRLRSSAQTRSSTALRNAHALQIDSALRSRDRARAKAKAMAETLCELRVQKIAELRSLMPISYVDNTLTIMHVEIPNLAALPGLQPDVLIRAIDRVCLLVTLMAKYLDILLPYEIILRPHVGIRRRPTVESSSSSSSSSSSGQYRKLAISGEVSALALRERSRRELDTFMEAVALLVCDIVYLTTSVVPVEREELAAGGLKRSSNSSREELAQVCRYLDIGALLWQALQQYTIPDLDSFEQPVPDSATATQQPSRKSKFVDERERCKATRAIVDPAIVLVALKEKNRINAEFRAWAEWQIVEAGGDGDPAEDVLLVDAADYGMEEKTGAATSPEKTDKNDEKWTDVRRRPRRRGAAE